MADNLRSWIASNWNTKTVVIAAIATGTGLAAVYVWKWNTKQYIAEMETEFGMEYDRLMTGRKQKLFGQLKSLKDARGDGRLVVLEIGCGAGNNFKYYPAGSEVICIDPIRHFEAALYESARKHPEIHISAFHVSSAENMQAVQTGSVDAVVSTLVLCSVGNLDQCLREIIRILKPGGKLYFLEHVRAPPEFYLTRLVQMLYFVWPILNGGCRVTRIIQNNIRKAGFSSVDIEEFQANELKQIDFYAIPLVLPHISGTATK